MMKNIFVLLNLIFFTACATTPALPPQQTAFYNFIPDGGRAAGDLEITGLNAFVGTNIKGASKNEAAIVARVKAEAEAKLKTAGFKIVSKKIQAHVWLELKYKVTGFEEAFPEHATEKVNGETPASLVLHRIVTVGGTDYAYSLDSSKSQNYGIFSFTVIAQEFGKHAQTAYWLSIRGPANNPDFSVAMETAGKSWVDELYKLKSMVKEKKQAGPPGCTTQFGFEVEPLFKDGVLYQKVTSVGKVGTPARQAGMKVGDFLVSISSVSYAEFEAKTELSEKAYSEKIPVPVVLLRNKKEIQAKIKAKVLCDGFQY